jgi:RNA polymerase sigma factor (sigma-70 family)
MDTWTAWSDEDLLVSHESEAFAVFYDRHVRTLLGYFARRTGDPEIAADLTAETFASAIVAQERYRRRGDIPAMAWLFTIAQRRLADYQRRGSCERRMLRSLAMERPPLSGEDAEMIRLLAEDAVGALLAPLTPDQRDAINAHVVEDRSYTEVAASTRSSEGLVRQRVSRGLSQLRRRIGARQ